ncbi:MAG: hypothetical protein JSW73_04625 [Candidatus Woesearchaeota archaeon]|nr:MAG: hypothetical protein JSW73_04625 [Candidatus Woesearchaeota archaeon]
MLFIENWIIILIVAVLILVIYAVLYKITLSKRLHTLTEEHRVSEPHNDLALLRTFVEKCWEKGYSIPEIKSVLVKKGWNEDTINKVFYKSKVPNEEKKFSRVRKAFSIKPKESKPPVARPQVIKPQVQLKPLKSEEKVKAVKKKSEPPVATNADGDLEIGEGSTAVDDDYKESGEVTKLKKEVLKDVKD